MQFSCPTDFYSGSEILAAAGKVQRNAIETAWQQLLPRAELGRAR